MSSNLSDLELPPLLDIPDKLLPFVYKIELFKYFLAEGGRGSAKSQSVARTLLSFGEVRKLRIVCGREIQNSIEESVYMLLKDIITEHKLNYRIYKTKIVHRVTGTTFTFKGFREQGSVKIKGLEGVDILWIDEAQAISKQTLGIIIPTIRASRAKVFFTMNRYVVDDPVFVEFSTFDRLSDWGTARDDCLHVHIDYFENKHCPETLKHEAEILKSKNMEEYLHIWRGIPLKQAQNAAFRNVDGIVDDDMPYEIPPDPRFHYVLGADYAKSVDHTVFTVICVELKKQAYFERVENENKASWFYQKQKTLAIARKYNNALIVPDSTGVGDPIVEDLERMGGNVYYEEKESGASTPGVKFTGISKENLIEKLKVAIEMQSFRIPRIKDDQGHQVQINELVKFEAKKMPSGKFRYAAPEGKDEEGNDIYHDDCVISLALAIWGARDFLYLDEFKEPKEPTEDDLFWKRVKQDIKRNRNKSLTTEEIETNLEDESGFDLISE